MLNWCAPEPETEVEDVVVPTPRVLPPSVEPPELVVPTPRVVPPSAELSELVDSLVPTVVDTNPPLPLLPVLVPLVDVAEPVPEPETQHQNAAVAELWIPLFWQSLVNFITEKRKTQLALVLMLCSKASPNRNSNSEHDWLCFEAKS